MAMPPTAITATPLTPAPSSSRSGAAAPPQAHARPPSRSMSRPRRKTPPSTRPPVRHAALPPLALWMPPPARPAAPTATRAAMRGTRRRPSRRRRSPRAPPVLRRRQRRRCPRGGAPRAAPTGLKIWRDAWSTGGRCMLPTRRSPSNVTVRSMPGECACSPCAVSRCRRRFRRPATRSASCASPTRRLACRRQRGRDDPTACESEKGRTPSVPLLAESRKAVRPGISHRPYV